MSNENPDTSREDSAIESSDETPTVWWKRWGKALILRGFLYYFIICLAMMFLQRSLIYHPAVVESLPVSEAALPPGRIRDIQIQTADNLELAGWHIHRKGWTCEDEQSCGDALAETRCLVLYFHGNAGNRLDKLAYAELFAGLGADVFLVDYRGYGENAGSPSEQGLAEDARAVWRFATEEHHVPRSKIVILGESLGGGVAVELVCQLCVDGTPPAGLILRSTFSSLADAAGRRFPWLPVRWLLWDKYDSDQKIANITCPILMMHGTADRIVAWQSGRDLFDKAPTKASNGMSKQFFSFEGGNHNQLLSTHKLEIENVVRQFFKQLDPEIGKE